MHPIGQHFIGGFDGTEVTPELRKLIKKYQIGGFILFKRNIESPAQVKKLIADLQKISSIPLFMGVDHEGGNVFRLGPPFTQVPPMAVVGKYYRKTKKIGTVFQLGELLGKELRAVGFNWNYAPVVDVHSNPKNPVIGKRAFGPDPVVVSRCAAAVMKGLHSAGVLSCAKHFPGHGATIADSHFDLPVLNDPGRLLWKRDIFPYRKLIAKKLLKTIMIAHVSYPELDENDCATLSRPIITDLLRKKMKFSGLIVSDDLRMKAISDRYGLKEASLQFFRAGGDMAMICREPHLQMEAIDYVRTHADGDLQKHFSQSFRRIQKLKNQIVQAKVSFPVTLLPSPAHQKIVAQLM
ncbi:MAG: beta-N-acetylhexosaminidase [Deltaproteobacteria bacterium]|nr:beta-N-acetylhexosaminidase [Deltaproteobacteria bacterium]